MFDSVACCRMRLATVPTVSCGALLDLKALLRCAPLPDSDVVLQGQHHSLLSPGGADAKITNPTESRSIQTVSSTPERPSWQLLPPEVRGKAERLLARLLREHIGRVHVSGSKKGAGDE